MSGRGMDMLRVVTSRLINVVDMEWLTYFSAQVSIKDDRDSLVLFSPRKLELTFHVYIYIIIIIFFWKKK